MLKLMMIPLLVAGMTAAAQNQTQSVPKPVNLQVFCPSPELLYKQTGEFPFAYFWRRDYIDMRKFETIVLKPPVSQFWFNDNDSKRISKEQLTDWQTGVNSLNERFDAAFTATFRSGGRFIELRRTDKAGEFSIVLEVALIPLMPLESFCRYVSFGDVDAGGNLVDAMAAAGFLSVEAVVRNAQGELVAQLCSRLPAYSKFSITNAKTWREGADAAIQQWNNDFISVIKTELNRAKDGTYIAISGKPVVVPATTPAPAK